MLSKADNMYGLLKKLRSYEKTINSYAFGEYAHASFLSNTSETDVMNFLRDGGIQNISLHKTEPTIEDCFIKLLKN